VRGWRVGSRDASLVVQLSVSNSSYLVLLPLAPPPRRLAQRGPNAAVSDFERVRRILSAGGECVELFAGLVPNRQLFRCFKNAGAHRGSLFAAKIVYRCMTKFDSPPPPGESLKGFERNSTIRDKIVNHPFPNTSTFFRIFVIRRGAGGSENVQTFCHTPVQQFGFFYKSRWVSLLGCHQKSCLFGFN